MKFVQFHLRIPLFIAILIACAPVSSAQKSPPIPKPVIRAITAFAIIDPAHVDSDVESVVKVLKTAKESFEQAGYQVQTLRITTQSFEHVTRRMSREQTLEYYRSYEAAIKKEGVISAIGPAFMHEPDHKKVELFAEILAEHSSFNGTILVTDEKGIAWPAIHEAAFVMKYLENHTPKGQGNFSFAAAASVGEYSPFFPTSYFIVPDHRFSIALQGAGIVDDAFSRAKGGDLRAATDAFDTVLRVGVAGIGQVVAEIKEKTGWEYEGLDASTAPLQDVSIGAAIEKLSGTPLGSPGTMTVAAAITHVLKEAPGELVGFNGIMLPVLEDVRIAQRWSEGRLTLDSLLAYSAVCGTGLDTVPLPGDVTEDQLARIIGDVASLSVKWNKPLSVRLFPVPGKKAGDRTEFDSPFLVNATLQKLP